MANPNPRDDNRIPTMGVANATSGFASIPVAGLNLFSGYGAIAMAIVDGNGTQITSFGGGTQYTNGAAAPTNPIGTMPVFNNAGTISQVSNTIGLPVNIVGGSSSGTQYADGAARGTATGTLGMVDDGTLIQSQTGSTLGEAFSIIRDAAGNARGANVDANNTLLMNNAYKLDSTNDSVTASNTTGNVASGVADSGNPVKVGAVYNSTQPSLTTGQRVDLQTGSRGSLRTEIFGANGTIGASALAPSDGVSQQNGIATFSQNLVYNGTTLDRLRSAAGGTGTQAIGGLTASGSSLAVAPVTIGGQAKTANPTAVTDGQVVNATFDKLGKQVVVGSIRDLKVNQITTIAASTSETTVLTSVASTFLDVYGVIVVNSSATATNVSFKDSTAGTTRFNIYVPAGDTRGFMLPESGAVAQTTVANNWTATSSASVTSLVITMLAVKNI